MADPKRQLIRLIERAHTDDIVREGQRGRAVEKSQTRGPTKPYFRQGPTRSEFHNLPRFRLPSTRCEVMDTVSQNLHTS